MKGGNKLKDKLYTVGSYVLAVLIIMVIAISIIILIPIAAIGILAFILISLVITLLYIIIGVPIYFICEAIKLLYKSINIYIKMVSLNIKHKISKRKKDKENVRS